MKKLIRILALLLLAPCVAHATAYTASVSGNVNSSATFGGSGPPNCSGGGDTIVVNQGITLTMNISCSLGTSAANNTTTALACATFTNSGTGAVVFTTGTTFTYKGLVEACGSGWVYPAGLTIIHDSSAALGAAVVTPTGTWTVGTTGACPITLSAGTSVAVGQLIKGTGIPNGTQVYSISGTTLNPSQCPTVTGTGVTLSFYTNIGYSWIHPTTCSNCVMNLAGTNGNPITWTIASGSGYTGPIGSNVSATYMKTLEISYTNFDHIGASNTGAAIQTQLTTSGYTFSMLNWTCNYCGAIDIGAVVSGAIVDIENFSYVSIVGAGPTYRGISISGVATDAGTPTRKILNGTVDGGTALYLSCATNGVDPVFLIESLFITNEGVNSADGYAGQGGTSNGCVFSGTTYSQVLDNIGYQSGNTLSGAASGWFEGTSSRNYFLEDAGGLCSGANTNYHFINETTNTWHVNQGIFEGDCTSSNGTGSVAAGHAINQYGTSATATWAGLVDYSIVVPSSSGTGGAPNLYTNNGACSTSGPVLCNQVTMTNNTLNVISGATGTGDCGLGAQEAGGITFSTGNSPFPSATNNIGWVAGSGNTGCKVNNATASIPAGMNIGYDYNWWYNFTLGVGYTGSPTNYASPSPPGTHDTANSNPQFAGCTFNGTKSVSNCNFGSWCQSLDPTITGATTSAIWQACKARFVSQTAGFTATALISWVQAGYVPNNVATATAGSSGTQVGAMPYAPLPSGGLFDMIP